MSVRIFSCEPVGNLCRPCREPIKADIQGRSSFCEQKEAQNFIHWISVILKEVKDPRFLPQRVNPAEPTLRPHSNG